VELKEVVGIFVFDYNHCPGTGLFLFEIMGYQNHSCVFCGIAVIVNWKNIK